MHLVARGAQNNQMADLVVNALTVQMAVFSRGQSCPRSFGCGYAAFRQKRFLVAALPVFRRTQRRFLMCG